MEQQGRLIHPKAGLPVVIEGRHEDFVRVRPKGMTDTIWMLAWDLDCPEAEVKTSPPATAGKGAHQGRKAARGQKLPPSDDPT